MIVRIPTYWIDEAMTKREMVNTYKTNRFVKHIGIYCLLKTITSTGIIHNWSCQAQVRNMTKLSRNSFKASIHQLHEIGLLKLVKNDLILKGWDDASNILFDVDHDKEFTSFEYDIDNDAKIGAYFYALSIALNQKKQIKTFENRLKYNPHQKRILIEGICATYNMSEQQVNKMTSAEFMECAYQMQNHQFQSGTPRIDIFEVNTDINRNLMTMKSAWQFNSTKSISYHKRQLMAKGLTHTEKIGQLISSTKNRIRCVNGYSDGFDKNLRLPIWNRVDRIHIQFNVC